MKNGRRSKLSASAASYNKRQPRHCSRSASRRLARGCTQRKPKRKQPTKTKTSNENEAKTVLVLSGKEGYRYLWSSSIISSGSCHHARASLPCTLAGEGAAAPPLLAGAANGASSSASV